MMGALAREGWDPRMRELDRMIAVEDGKAPVLVVAPPRRHLAERAQEAMLQAQVRRAAEAEGRAKAAEGRAQKSGEAAGEALARVTEQERVIQDLSEKVGLLSRELGVMRQQPWSRRCFLCGALGWCEHREPELAEGPPPWRAKL